MRPVSPRGLAVVAVAVAVLVATIGVAAVLTPVTQSSNDDDPPSTIAAPNATGLAGVHAAGITGSNVTIGVVDVTGFDADHPELADRVVESRSFAPGERVDNRGRNSHGTAAASLVARTAPESDLYLASFDTVDGYERAVEWLVSEDVDVVVAPVAFYGKPDDGTSRVASVAEQATQRGVVFVAPVGNLGRGHWTGRYRPVGDGVHRFEDGTRNYLRPVGGQNLRLWLSWDRQHASEDYTAELYWTNGTARRLVARSQPFPGDDVPNERIVAQLDEGSYYVRVTGPQNETAANLTLESPTHTLQIRTRAESIAAPASAPGVLAVGAYDREHERVAPLSSAGPTRDGRVGVDVVAPHGLPAATKPAGFEGTSAAAPYVAGTVALVLDAGADRPLLTLERSAENLRATGRDPVSGAGRVRPVTAVRLASDDSNDD